MPILHKTKTEIYAEFPYTGVLNIENLSFTYPDGQNALKEVSLQINPGEKVALVGPNGSGKSTLMLNIIGILQGQGKIELGEIPVIEETLRKIRSHIGIVFQNPDDQLFSPTVYEDVAFGPLHMGLPEEEVHERVQQALEMVEMSAYAQRLSHHLSMGEKKKIAIATVLSMQPGLLILDEPTAGLDPRARRNLINLMGDLPLSLLAATHDLMMVKELFPRMVILDEGRVVADGDTEELLGDVELLEKHGLEMPG